MKKEPTLFEALVPLIVLIGLIIVNVNFTFGDDILGGPNQMALIFGAVTAALVGWRLGFKWDFMLKKITKSIHAAMPSMLILLLIGALAGTWLVSGVIPAMIYYGLDILSPKIFLFASCLLCMIVSTATGSSWTTSATIGVALLGVGKALGVHEGITAGAIISGAYFGDKMSPLSDTTNLAPAMAGTDLITHVRYMALTTVPAMVITLLLFLFIGFGNDGAVDISLVNEIQSAIISKFYISPVLFLVPLVVIGFILFKVKPIPSIFAGTILGLIFAIIFQPNLLMELAPEGSYLKQTYMASINIMTTSTQIDVENKAASELLTADGMGGMMNTIWFIISAMIFGGIMEGLGLLKRIMKAMMSLVNNTWSLISTTSLSCIFMNFTASEQYISIVVPGRMFSQTYRENGLAPENLSRTLEDSGTVTSVLCPWNACNAFHMQVLPLSNPDPLAFIPYCFFNILSPITTVIFAVFMIKIKKLKVKPALK